MNKVNFVYFGEIQAMIAECATWDMGEEWFAENNVKYAVQIIGDGQWDADYCATLDEAKACAKELGKVFEVEVVRVY